MRSEGQRKALQQLIPLREATVPALISAHWGQAMADGLHICQAPQPQQAAMQQLQGAGALCQVPRGLKGARCAQQP